MKKALVLIVVTLLCAGGAVMADTASEIRQLIIEENEQLRKTLKGQTDNYSEEGALEFWSSGGLMHEVTSAARPDEYEMFTIRPKHIEVITLVEGKAAVAMYYSEGAMKPKSSPSVSHYMTRATQVFVKENGKWKTRAAHWSPIQGGGGTSQTALD